MKMNNAKLTDALILGGSAILGGIIGMVFSKETKANAAKAAKEQSYFFGKQVMDLRVGDKFKVANKNMTFMRLGFSPLVDPVLNSLAHKYVIATDERGQIVFLEPHVRVRSAL